MSNVIIISCWIKQLLFSFSQFQTDYHSWQWHSLCHRVCVCLCVCEIVDTFISSPIPSTTHLFVWLIHSVPHYCRMCLSTFHVGSCSPHNYSVSLFQSCFDFNFNSSQVLVHAWVCHTAFGRAFHSEHTETEPNILDRGIEKSIHNYLFYFYQETMWKVKCNTIRC